MPSPHQNLKVVIWKTYNKTVLFMDLTGKFSRFNFSTGLHGGFKECYITVPMPISSAWQFLNRENMPGAHYYHLEVLEDKRVVWEGRLMDITFRSDPGFIGVDLTAFGYWSSCRDQYYDPDEAGNTNWKLGGPHNVGKVIREIITNECPDISGTADIDLNSRDIVGLDITDRKYPMDIIVDKLAPLSDDDASIWYFAVWVGRKPYWKKRSVSQVDWYVYLRDIRALRIAQEGKHLRNYILPVVGTAEGSGTIDAESTADYPRRELILLLPAGVPTAVANDARDLALAERKFPRQDEDMTIDGRVYSTQVGRTATDPGGLTAAAGAFIEQPKWWVRAGDVLRIQDLIPASASTPKLDDLRTFFLLETSYDAINDVLTIRPDRPGGRLDVLMARLGQMERQR